MGRKKLYELTDEHRAQLAPWRDKWIANAMSTAAMTAADREIVRDAVNGMYDAAKIPRPKHIVFVPSPFVAAFAGGFAAWIWHRFHGYEGAATGAATWDATRAATRAATRDATRAATYAATDAATWDATRDATRDATYAATDAATDWDATGAATRAATYAATRDATRAATDAATWAATWAATYAATYAATRDAGPLETDTWFRCGTDAIILGAKHVAGSEVEAKNWLAYAANFWRMRQGGNQWSGSDSFLSFFDRVVGLDLPEYTAWRHWEQLSLHSGPRIVHADFCMISDRPERLLVDDQNRPHCDDGPFCRWRDGSSLYAVHGVRVPWWIIEHPERLTAARITAEQNAEVRRVMMQRFTAARYMQESGAKLIQTDECGKLWKQDQGDDEPLVMVEVENSTPEPDGSIKHYWLRVPPTCTTARQAVAWTFDVPANDYRPEVQT